MLEPQRVHDPVHGVEEERHVDRLGQRVVVHSGRAGALDVGSRHGRGVARQRVDECRRRHGSRIEALLVEPGEDVVTELLGGDLAVSADTELARVPLLEMTVANSLPFALSTTRREEVVREARSGSPRYVGHSSEAFPTSSVSASSVRVMRTKARR